MITRQQARRELELRILADPLVYARTKPSHNLAQVRAIQAVERGDPMTICTFGNGAGKTHVLISMWSAIMFGTKNPLFQKGVFKEWPKGWPKTCRLCAPESLLGDRDVVQSLMLKLFPKGKWTQQKNHKNIYCSGQTTNGWSWDVMTYDQQALQAAGETKGLLLYSEPPPKPLFNENMARLRAGGMCIMEMTPLNMSPWVMDEYIDQKYIRNEKGEVIGQINHIQGDIWDNCDEKPGGQLPRQAIELTIAQYSDDERELREKGIFGRLQGRIYKAYDPLVHEIETLEPYHKECFEKGKYTLYTVLDPHDRKPFAMGWYAVFPNEDVVVMAEFPDDSFPLFHKLNAFSWTPEEYAQMIRVTETEGFKKPAEVRWVDPNFGQTQKFDTKMTIRQALYKWGQDHHYELNFGLPNDALADGHMAVKSMLGEPIKGIRPKIYVMKHCKNHIYGFTHYAYKEYRDNITKGLSEAPQLVYKDFPDLVRYLCIMGPRYIEPIDKDKPRPEFFTRPKYPGRK
jgi:hypothetical protein